jgi:cupin fold WbuC family metalloprotein
VRIKQKNPEVYLADEPIVKVGPGEIAFLKERVSQTPRGRVRLCAHAGNNDPLHEMIIVMLKQTYIHPHKHLNKSESFHIIEGAVDIVVFDDQGEISEVIELGAPGSGRNLFYRNAAPVYHTLLIRSDLLIIHETTNGPFRQDEAIFAPWAPKETDATAVNSYIAALANSVAKLARTN